MVGVCGHTVGAQLQVTPSQIASRLLLSEHAPYGQLALPLHFCPSFGGSLEQVEPPWLPAQDHVWAMPQTGPLHVQAQYTPPFAIVHGVFTAGSQALPTMWGALQAGTASHMGRSMDHLPPLHVARLRHEVRM